MPMKKGIMGPDLYHGVDPGVRPNCLIFLSYGVVATDTGGNDSEGLYLLWSDTAHHLPVHRSRMEDPGKPPLRPGSSCLILDLY